MEQDNTAEKYPFITDALFIGADFTSIALYRKLYESVYVEGLLVVQSVIFCLSAWLIIAVHQTRFFQMAQQELSEKIPHLLFWLKLSHVFAFIYIPVGLFVYFVSEAGQYTGEGEFVLIVFYFFPPPRF